MYGRDRNRSDSYDRNRGDSYDRKRNDSFDRRSGESYDRNRGGDFYQRDRDNSYERKNDRRRDRERNEYDDRRRRFGRERSPVGEKRGGSFDHPWKELFNKPPNRDGAISAWEELPASKWKESEIELQKNIELEKLQKEKAEVHLLKEKRKQLLENDPGDVTQSRLAVKAGEASMDYEMLPDGDQQPLWNPWAQPPTMNQQAYGPQLNFQLQNFPQNVPRFNQGRGLLPAPFQRFQRSQRPRGSFRMHAPFRHSSPNVWNYSGGTNEEMEDMGMNAGGMADGGSLYRQRGTWDRQPQFKQQNKRNQRMHEDDIDSVDNLSQSQPKAKLMVDKRTNPLFCNYCNLETNTLAGHTKHLQTKQHRIRVQKRENSMVMQMQENCIKGQQRSNANVGVARSDGRQIHFCASCFLEYWSSEEAHFSSQDHKANNHSLPVHCAECDITIPSRFLYDQHILMLQHIRNHMYKLIEEGKLDAKTLECPKEYDSSKSVGQMAVVDVRVRYCKVCKKLFSSSVNKHCRTSEHYNNFKSFYEKYKRTKGRRRFSPLNAFDISNDDSSLNHYVVDEDWEELNNEEEEDFNEEREVKEDDSQDAEDKETEPFKRVTRRSSKKQSPRPEESVNTSVSESTETRRESPVKVERRKRSREVEKENKGDTRKEEVSPNKKYKGNKKQPRVEKERKASAVKVKESEEQNMNQENAAGLDKGTETKIEKESAADADKGTNEAKIGKESGVDMDEGIEQIKSHVESEGGRDIDKGNECEKDKEEEDKSDMKVEDEAEKGREENRAEILKEIETEIMNEGKVVVDTDELMEDVKEVEKRSENNEESEKEADGNESIKEDAEVDKGVEDKAEVDQKNENGVRIDQVSDDGIEIDRESEEGMDQISEECAKREDEVDMDQRSEEGVDVDQGSEEVDERSEDVGEVDKKSEDGVEMVQESEDVNETDRKSEDGANLNETNEDAAEVDRNEADAEGDKGTVDGVECDQRNEDMAEIDQGSENGAGLMLEDDSWGNNESESVLNTTADQSDAENERIESQEVLDDTSRETQDDTSREVPDDASREVHDDASREVHDEASIKVHGEVLDDTSREVHDEVTENEIFCYSSDGEDKVANENKEMSDEDKEISFEDILVTPEGGHDATCETPIQEEVGAEMEVQAVEETSEEAKSEKSPLPEYGVFYCDVTKTQEEETSEDNTIDSENNAEDPKSEESVDADRRNSVESEEEVPMKIPSPKKRVTRSSSSDEPVRKMRARARRAK